MGRRAQHFKCPILFLQRSWAAEKGLPGDLYEYLQGVAAGLLEWADRGRLDFFDRVLLADLGRLHRTQVESKSDGVTRSRMVGTFERGLARLERKWRGRPVRMKPPTRTYEDVSER
jgi:hypothetical protein